MIIVIISFLIMICILSFFVTNNPIYNVLSLIIIFLLVNCIFLLLNLDFLALMMIIVYVGAIAILFLFIVMMINIKILEKSFWNMRKKIPLSLLIIVIFGIQLLITINNLYNVKDTIILFNSNNLTIYPYYDKYFSINNFKVFANLIYNDMYMLLVIASIILLLAMVAAISLTFKNKNTLRQQLYVQLLRKNTIQHMFRTTHPHKLGFWLINSWRRWKDDYIIRYTLYGINNNYYTWPRIMKRRKPQWDRSNQS